MSSIRTQGRGRAGEESANVCDLPVRGKGKADVGPGRAEVVQKEEEWARGDPTGHRSHGGQAGPGPPQDERSLRAEIPNKFYKVVFAFGDASLIVREV